MTVTPHVDAATLAASIARQLANSGVPTPEADARWLIEGIIGVDPHRVPTASIRPGERDAVQAAVERRARREPLQLIVGSAPFLDLELTCEPGVFIPRPETEILAREAQRLAGTRGAGVRVVEPCTGTGAVTCALVAHVPGIAIIAVDDDPRAVALAQRNLDTTIERRSLVDVDAHVRLGDLLDPIDAAWRGTIDVLVANPPYLPARDIGAWPPEVANHDPHHALVGGVDGHEVVDRLIDLGVDWLANGGWLLVEIDPRQAASAQQRALSAGYSDVAVVADLTGAARVLRARWTGSAVVDGSAERAEDE